MSTLLNGKSKESTSTAISKQVSAIRPADIRWNQGVRILHRILVELDDIELAALNDILTSINSDLPQLVAQSSSISGNPYPPNGISVFKSLQQLVSTLTNAPTAKLEALPNKSRSEFA